MPKGDPTAQLCAVCGEAPKNYKCPKCSIVYCSVRCYKAHTSGCVPSLVAVGATSTTSTHRVTASSSSSSAASSSSQSYNDDSKEDEEDLASRLPPERLVELAANPGLRVALRDPRLRKVLADIDCAADRPAALAHYRRTEGERFCTAIDDMLIAVGVAERDAASNHVTYVGLT
jgi:hypothetical protein